MTAALAAVVGAFVALLGVVVWLLLRVWTLEATIEDLRRELHNERTDHANTRAYRAACIDDYEVPS